MKLRTLYKTFRTQEWWAYKIPGVLAVGYATTIKVGASLEQVMPSILFALLSIVVGAIYVSTINDITDIEEDLNSGKDNRMAKLSARYRWMIPCFFAALGSYFTYLYLPDTLSATLYVLPWISFTLYSFKPVRLKQRGVWGVVADATGAHLFINMLMVSHVTYVSGQTVDVHWLTAVGVWSFLVGLRGILEHQFSDRKHDLIVRSTTFATSTTPQKFRRHERFIFIVELAALSAILSILSIKVLLIALLFYSLLSYLRHKILGYKAVIILNNKRPSQILLLDFYQVVLPVTLLAYICWTESSAYLILALHVLLFPDRLKNIVMDWKIISQTAFKKVFKIY